MSSMSLEARLDRQRKAAAHAPASAKAPDWQEQAACRGTYLAAGEKAELMRLCQQCGVRKPCLSFAVDMYVQTEGGWFGVWGGVDFGIASRGSGRGGGPTIDAPRLRAWAERNTE